MRASEGQNFRKIEILNKNFEKQRRSAKTQKKREKGGLPTLSHDPGTIRGATLPPGAPRGRPRARGVYLINQVMKE